MELTFDATLPDDVRTAVLACVQLVDDYDDGAEKAFAALAERVTPDRALALATHRALAAGFQKIYNGDWTSRAWRAALDVAAADTTPDGIAHWTELSIEAAVALEDELMEDDVDRVIADLVARTGAALAIRLRLADAFAKAYESKRARQQLRAALELELASDDRLDLLLRLAEDGDDEPDEHARLLGDIATLAAGAITVDLRVRSHLALARGRSSDSFGHAAAAAELAPGCVDRDLSRAALLGYAERLFDAGDLAGAEAIVIAQPHDDTGPNAFLEDIQRRRGLRGEPPPEAFAEVPVEAVAALPEGFVAYFTPGDPLTLLREGRLVSPEKIREWSHGVVRSPIDLESEKIFGPLRSYACRCGRFLGYVHRGVVCHKCGVEVINRASRTVRVAHLQLPRPVVHPWYVPVVAQILELSQPAVKAMNPETLRDQLRDKDLYSIAARLRHEVEGHVSERRRTEMTARLEIVDALVDSMIRPEWCVLELVPVWPPEAELPSPLDRAGLRTCYVDIIEPPDLAKAVRRLFTYVARHTRD